MELQFPVPIPAEFNFDSTCSSPYMTAPSSPRRFGSSLAGVGNCYYSAPASPTRISAAFYSDLSVPFKWEDKPGVPTKPDHHQDDDSFQFDFSGHLDPSLLSELSAADELFHAGVIRPLKPPPGSPLARTSPRSPRSKILSHALSISSPKKKKEDFEVDPFAAAIEENRRRDQSVNRTRSRARSLSPMRVSDVVFSPEDDQASVVASNKQSSSAYSAIMSAFSGGRKWRLKDLLLFRSASEGRAPRNDNVLLRRTEKNKNSGKVAAGEEVRNSSFRSTESVGSVSSRRRSAAAASAHEIHYTANRAVSEEMRRKTYLPYKQGLLGCLGFAPGVHEVSRRFGSWSRPSNNSG